MTTAGTSHRLTGYGLAVELADRWEGRIYQRPVPAPAMPSGALPAVGLSGSKAGGSSSVARWSDERSHPIMHLANFALPGARGDYGTGAVERMGSDDVFIALLQFGADCLDTALFAPRGLPAVRAADFNPNGLQRKVAGQAGFQHFCTLDGPHGSRPMCLYVVLGAHRQAAAQCGPINQVLDRVEVTA
ncbi:MAG: hypothetical protein ABI140_21305 [Jatrophihabitantaceae bacterium]